MRTQTSLSSNKVKECDCCPLCNSQKPQNERSEPPPVIPPSTPKNEVSNTPKKKKSENELKSSTSSDHGGICCFPRKKSKSQKQAASVPQKAKDKVEKPKETEPELEKCVADKNGCCPLCKQLLPPAGCCEAPQIISKNVVQNNENVEIPSPKNNLSELNVNGPESEKCSISSEKSGECTCCPLCDQSDKKTTPPPTANDYKQKSANVETQVKQKTLEQKGHADQEDGPKKQNYPRKDESLTDKPILSSVGFLVKPAKRPERIRKTGIFNCGGKKPRRNSDRPSVGTLPAVHYHGALFDKKIYKVSIYRCL